MDELMISYCLIMCYVTMIVAATAATFYTFLNNIIHAKIQLSNGFVACKYVENG